MVAKGTHIEIIKNDLPKIAGEMEGKTRQVVEETVLFIEGQAASSAPIGETGNLANGNQSEVSESGDGIRGEVWNIMDYAAYVNYGTGSRGASSSVPDRPPEIAYTGSWLGQPARPFMSQAAADAKPRFYAGLEKITG